MSPKRPDANRGEVDRSDQPPTPAESNPSQPEGYWGRVKQSAQASWQSLCNTWNLLKFLDEDETERW